MFVEKFIAVFICLVLSVFATVPQYEKFTGEILFYMEVVMVSWFIIELIARIWSSGCRSRYMHLIGRLRFMIRPFTLLDFIVIIASLIVLLLGSTGQVFAASALRSLRFFQILRMVRMDRRGGTWKLLGSVVWAHRQELITTLYIGFLGLILSSFLVYLVEKNENPQKFGTYADALWWGVVTLCTVGYGDAVPITWSGKLIASFCALMGISFFALPAGILGSGFALKVQQQQRQKHLNRRRVPAAILIQSLWRCYAADIKSTSEATWKIFYNANSYSPTPYFPAPSIFKHNTSFVSRFSSRKYRSTVQMSNPVTSPVSKKVNIYTSIASNGVDDIMHHLNLTSSSETLNIKNPNENEIVPIQIKLDDVHKDAIRCLRKIKYFVARRKFREALKPYDVKDVLEQYAAGHIDLISRVKILQHRFDMILGQQETKNKDVYISNYSLASRIVNIERQVDDIEHKIDTLIDMHRSQTIEKKLMLNADINIEIDNEKDTLSLYSGKQIKCEKYETSDHFSKNKLPEHDQRINTESLNMKTHGIMNYSHHSNNASLNRDHPLHFAEDDEKKNFKEDIDGESYSFRNFQTNQKKKEKKRHKKNKKFLLKDISEESSI
ncbi:potassium voltage-gated channel subfamily KQT member 1-like [Gordionus sp. m RMFG-2023]|uniref:potassium voltage-gated channel subfamily KQT member 1-like n=1 Tax=Gordionus sp. m RMFG-2023 TaxID=3053472 RepID=UPI0031FC0B22